MILYTGSYTLKEGSPAPNPTGKGICMFEFDTLKGEFHQLGSIFQRSPSYIDGAYLLSMVQYDPRPPRNISI